MVAKFFVKILLEDFDMFTYSSSKLDTYFKPDITFLYLDTDMKNQKIRLTSEIKLINLRINLDYAYCSE